MRIPLCGICLLLLASSAGADIARFDRGESAIVSGPGEDWGRLSGTIRTTGIFGSDADGTFFIVSRRKTTDGRWRLEVVPPPAYSVPLTPVTIEVMSRDARLAPRFRGRWAFLSRAIFFDDFEWGGLWLWDFVQGGADLPEEGMPDPIAGYKVLHVVGVDSSDVSKDFLFSQVAGASASTDTPASIAFRTGLSGSNWTSWRALEVAFDESLAAYWPRLLGVPDHSPYTFSVPNPENPTTHVRPLDELIGYDFRKQEAILYACWPTYDGEKWVVSALGSVLCKIINRGTISSAAFGSSDLDEFSITFTEQTPDGLNVPPSPVLYLGLSGGFRTEPLGGPTSGPRVERPDAASLRGQGDQWFSTGLYRDALSTPTATDTFLASPIFRARHDHSAGTLILQLRNAAGTWQDIGTSPTFTDGTFFGVGVNYELATTTATLYVDGTAAGSTVVTGGIFAASSGTMTFYKPAGLTGTTMFFFRHGTRLLTVAEMAIRSQYSFDFAAETALDCALEFHARTGVYIADFGGTADAEAKDFASPNAAWIASASGGPAQSQTRPPVVVGRPFMATLETVDVAQNVFTTGYEGIDRDVRFVASANSRLAPSDLNVTGNSIFVAPRSVIATNIAEPALGQVLTYSELGSPNEGDHIVAELGYLSLAYNPLVGLGLGGFRPSVDISQDLINFGTWTTTGDWEDWKELGIQAGFGLAKITRATNETDLSASHHTHADDATTALAEAFLERLGPEAAVATENVRALTLASTGWQGDGDGTSLEPVAFLSFVTPSDSGDAPSITFRDSTGAWILRGFDRSPSSPAYTWDDEQIERAVPIQVAARPASLRVRYGRAYQRPANVMAPTDATADTFPDAAAVEWRSVVVGSGNPELVLETAFLLEEDADAWGTAILDIIENGHPYKLYLRMPRSPAEVQMEPYEVANVTFSPDSYLSGSRDGMVVGRTLRDDEASVLVFFVGN